MQPGQILIGLLCGWMVAALAAAAPDMPQPEAPPEALILPAAAEQPEPDDAQAAQALADANASRAAALREMFALYGFDAARWDAVVDGSEVPHDQQSPEFDLLVRLLFTAQRFTPLEMFHWRQQGIDWTALAGRAGANRGQILDLEGKVVFAQAIDLGPDLIERFELQRIYQCEMLLGDDQSPATLFALAIPSAWPLDEPIDERATARAFFFKRGGEPPSNLQPVFAAPRVAWHPDGLLGEMGMDVGLFDTVHHRTTGLAAERECFYQLLAACKNVGPNELARHAAGHFSVVPLFNKPEENTGKLVGFTGVARRIVKVLVEDPDVVERFGIDHYYQLAVFTSDSQDHPIIFSVLELPDEMPTGERLHEPVRISGFFTKLWGYRAGDDPNVDESALTDEQRAQLARVRHLAPLLIGRAPLWLQPQKSSWASWVGIGFSLLLVLMIVVMWGVVWWQNAVERRFHERTLGRHFAPADGTSLNELPLEYRPHPDFSNLPQ